MRARGGDLSVSMAVLSLVVEQPDSVAGVGRRLAERFPNARFGRNAAHKSLPSLEKQGLVCVVTTRKRRSLDIYEATPAGVGRVREWLHDSSAVLPALRDDLRAKLQHVRDEADLRRLMDAIGEQEDACNAEYARAHAARKAAARLRGWRDARDRDWRDTVERTLICDEAVLWGSRAMRLQRLRECLEGRTDFSQPRGGGE
jgi:DNA-binding PadR family transcriptional regulator